MIKRFGKLLIPVMILAVLSAAIVYAAPGDENDPLITLSYIKDVLMPDIEAKIDKKVEEAISKIEISAPATGEFGSDSYTVVNVNAKYSVIGDEGTEMVVRSGSGTIISSAQGGVADLTVGTDLTNGTQAPLNHHLLIPRSDNRGIKFESDSIVLVKGTYKVTK